MSESFDYRSEDCGHNNEELNDEGLVQCLDETRCPSGFDPELRQVS
ncbi:hypothetical protein H7J07_05915 [Mycobacterium koreense]|nr:hypothetical protein [Mycolicibacillus koreensis]MCV7247762.1 hypothetical protein [Mycolicibacillus koreensis]